MKITEQLMNQLGVDEAQATSGAGLLFKLAEEQLSSGEFAQLRAAVPEIDQLIETAPDIGGGRLGGLGGLASVFGGKIGALGNLASLAEGFDDLGLDSGMVARFLPVVLSCVQARGGDGLRDMLAGVLAVENKG
jgi:hypothetical protein